jgi:hypothetical protein
MPKQTKKVVKSVESQTAAKSVEQVMVIECSEYCVAGDRESYKKGGCAGGFYPECQGKKRWFSCTASRV